MVYSVISYWMVGFDASAAKFFTFLLIVFIETEVCFSFCQLAAMCCESVNSAIAVYISFYLFWLALGGFIIPPDSIPVFLHFLMYCTPFW